MTSADHRPPTPVHDRAGPLALYLKDPAVHPYGIADVEQLWWASRWSAGGADRDRER